MDQFPDSKVGKPEAAIVEGSQATFMSDVVEASRHVPVLVDFWATWCGPCKTLTPTLEKVVGTYAGRVKLVKIDIDQNRALVQQLAGLGLPIQSVPTVAAFWQGQIADLFQGALPESEIRRFVDALLKEAGSAAPSVDMIAEARSAMDANDAERAAALFGAALDEDTERPEAWAGLVRAMIALGADERAEAVLSEVPPKLVGHAEIEAAQTALSVAREGREAARTLVDIQQKLAADPDDHETRLVLAVALNATGERAQAADALLEIMRRQRGWKEDTARIQLLKFFDAWGVEDPETMAARRKLSALLFS